MNVPYPGGKVIAVLVVGDIRNQRENGLHGQLMRTMTHRVLFGPYWLRMTADCPDATAVAGHGSTEAKQGRGFPNGHVRVRLLRLGRRLSAWAIPFLRSAGLSIGWQIVLFSLLRILTVALQVLIQNIITLSEV